MSAEELQEYLEQLDSVESGLKESPEDETLLELREELVQLITLLDQKLNGETTGTEEPPPPPPKEPEYEEIANNKPDYKPEANDKKEGKKPKEYKVGDTVLAKCVATDKQFHRAKVTSVTGSSLNPMLTVRFEHDKTIIDTLPVNKIRDLPFSHNTKPSYTPTPPPRAASVDGPSSKPPPRILEDDKAKVTKSHKTQPSKAEILKKSQTRWQDFQKKGLKKLKKTSASAAVLGSATRSGSSAQGEQSSSNAKAKRQRHVYNSKSVLG
ncbi:hypothetical protein TRVA0_015S01970 [Trichomonascus vanleenenianus]|uniref:uncharacterized protein n=1 Tax=Trichomonascus vanleenenianus TaxID=2268995 RepID=UPI003EC9CF48